MNRFNTYTAKALYAIISGTVGALAMMPFGFFFRTLEMRVGHYGPKFAALYLTSPTPLALMVQHIVLGWVSAIPLLFFPLHTLAQARVYLIGASYGTLYYVLVNSLALPIYFGDPLPWSLGVSVIIPSLVVHLVFGVAVAWALRFVKRAAFMKGFLK